MNSEFLDTRDGRLIISAVAAISLIAGITLVLAVTSSESEFNSARFKTHANETRLAMYSDLKSKNLVGSSKDEILQILGEPLLGITESNRWTYPMGKKDGISTDLVITFQNGAVTKIAKVKTQNIDE